MFPPEKREHFFKLNIRGIANNVKVFLTVLLLFLFAIDAAGQKALKDSLSKKEPIAIAEFGAATSSDLKAGKSSLGYSAAVEMTPIEDWLELELGVTPTFGSHFRETDADILFKKPWTFSPKLEFMFGVGLAWAHAKDHNVTTNTASGEVALDFMLWPYKNRRFGWYLEPAFDYRFSREREQSAGISGGLLIAIR
jgi:hypothetical protein